MALVEQRVFHQFVYNSYWLYLKSRQCSLSTGAIGLPIERFAPQPSENVICALTM